ncbi:NAD(P)-dependent oxidoreductase [Novosphingobium lentum]|uniref:NAD(P)-dependent oxidoreductase n=1 Tax=Novosphingobium lentum TaxID=145287 RepID=UPI000A0480AA|nr:NAD(P)-dependent oxidoreductase [Novosphingobium lentum]
MRITSGHALKEPNGLAGLRGQAIQVAQPATTDHRCNWADRARYTVCSSSACNRGRDWTTHTLHLLDRDRLLAMKPGALLINVSRGAIIDEAAPISAMWSRDVCPRPRSTRRSTFRGKWIEPAYRGNGYPGICN